MKHLLRVQHLSQDFGGIKALDDISFDIKEGEVVGLIGPNGSGKTTTLNLITGIYPISPGSIIFNGIDLSPLSMDQRARLGIARTFQSARVFPTLRVDQHTVIPWQESSHSLLKGILYSFLRRWHKAVDIDVFELVHWKDPLTTLGGSLPYGNQRILEIARALALKPRLLLLDEPAAGLNEQETKELGEVLREIHIKLGITMLLIDHDIDFVLELCPRLIVLDQGRLIADGPSEEVLRSPETKRAYLGED